MRHGATLWALFGINYHDALNLPYPVSETYLNACERYEREHANGR